MTVGIDTDRERIIIYGHYMIDDGFGDEREMKIYNDYAFEISGTRPSVICGASMEVTRKSSSTSLNNAISRYVTSLVRLLRIFYLRHEIT